ncbi:MAG: 3D domain-containing protein [Bacillota bacterium]|nr:3D domain-containing protein [Bacillota bacterium]
MNWLRQKIEENRQFYKVLAIAICINLGLIGFYAALSASVKDITLTVNGKTAKHKTIRNSVNDMLRAWEVTLGNKDQVNVAGDAPLKDGDEIEIRTFTREEKTVEEETDFKEKTKYSSDMLEGERKITTRGVKGLDKVTYSITYLGGKTLEKKEIGRETIKKPVTRVWTEGTAVSYKGVKYSRKLTVSSTAYCLRGRTATGTTVHYGTIAVDPSVIPLGSYGYVPGYGEVHAEDTGGAIKGKIIDLWFPSNGQCRSWGRRTVDIYIK